MKPEVLPPRRRVPILPFILLLAAGSAGTLITARRHVEDGRIWQASLQVRSYAGELPRWRQTHGLECPRSLGDLAGRVVEADPWGHPLRFACAEDPAEDFVASDGPDGRPGTRDDVRSR